MCIRDRNYEVSDNVIHKLSVDYIKHLSDFNNLIPNTLIVLDSLKLKYKMHIITNGFKEVQKRKLIKSNLVHYFKNVTISEDVGVKKPDKLIFNHAIKSAKATIENSIMIGCLLYTSPSPRDRTRSRMPSSA